MRKSAAPICETARTNSRHPPRRSGSGRASNKGEKMAALTNARYTPEMADGGRMRVYPVEANTNVCLGGIVALNAAGNAVPASATTSVANALKVIGRAEYVKAGIPGQNAINNPGVAGAISITAR